VNITLTLFFKSAKNAQELGPVLWKCLREVQQLFLGNTTGHQFVSMCIAPSVPDSFARELPEVTFRELQRIANIFPSRDFWAHSIGQYTDSYSVAPLAAVTRSLLNIKADEGLVLLIDTELSDPILVSKKQRYIIFADSGPQTQCVSVAVLDPEYWAGADSQRFEKLDRRFWAASCRAIGLMLGLSECTTRGCVFRLPIEGVRDLDSRSWICDKHGDSSLAGKCRSGETPRDV
jgi:predicted Zn-dependent protease